MQTLDLDKLRQEFNRSRGSVRLVAVYSPTCPVCIYGQGVVRKLLEEFGAHGLKGFAVWLPMMRRDSLERADAEAAPFEDLPVVHVWDPTRQVGNSYSKTLGLKSTAWDFYFLYPPGVTWDEEEPPDPAFWMHQLPADSGADRELVLYPSKFAQELLTLFGDGVEPSHTSREDLGLQLHWEGLLNMTRERGEYAIEDVREAFEDSKTVRGTLPIAED